MLEKIKSKFYYIKIFSYLDERQKLKIVKSNKSLQKRLNINIINHKFYSGKYVEYGLNNIVKEYNGIDNTLKFEGEYLKGEKNGFCKDYSTYSRFEGEYLKGRKNGKGKEYDNEGKLEFEGEYLNNKINGKGKEYNYKGKLQFEGEYLYGNKLIGKYYINESLEYEGEYRYNKKWNGKDMIIMVI